MKWVMKEPARGDMIRVESGSIYHFGIYVSDDEVIQFGLAPSQRVTLHDSEVEVLSSDIYAFLSGGFLEVCEFDRRERKKHRSPDEVVSYARSKLGTRGYNIIYNNCEHFANECISGQHICHQADDVRQMFRNMPIVDVYLAKLPARSVGEPLSCALRQEEIDEISNEFVKREKYYVWKLLEYGIERTFGLKIKNLDFSKDEYGRYKTDKLEFSLAHSKGGLAVAVSRAAVGVDLEAMDIERTEEMARGVMTQKDFDEYERLSENEKQKYLVDAWTAKEALFKFSHSALFEPRSYDVSEGGFRTFEKIIGDKTFSVSVATTTTERIRLFENIEL